MTSFFGVRQGDVGNVHYFEQFLQFWNGLYIARITASRGQSRFWRDYPGRTASGGLVSDKITSALEPTSRALVDVVPVLHVRHWYCALEPTSAAFCHVFHVRVFQVILPSNSYLTLLFDGSFTFFEDLCIATLAISFSTISSALEPSKSSLFTHAS